MKRGWKRLLAFCMLAAMVSTLVVGAGATGTRSGLRVSAQKTDGTIVELNSYSVLEDGWNDAMELAGDLDAMEAQGCRAVVVDLYSDWYAADGAFTRDDLNGPGFDNDTICIPGEANVILNLNGHTIDRGLTEGEDNGQVMYVSEGADLTINGGAHPRDTTVGTITGGFSDNGAGGLHINGASVTLNHVSVSGNRADGGHGGGIAAHNGAKLTINGGSFSGNTAHDGGAIYVTDSSLTMTDCTIRDNSAYLGGGIYMQLYIAQEQPDGFSYDKECKVTLENVEITGNRADEGHGGGIYMMRSTCLVLKGQTRILGNPCGGRNSDLYRGEPGSEALVDVTGLTQGSEICLESRYWGVVGLCTPETVNWVHPCKEGEAIWEKDGYMVLGDMEDAPAGVASILGGGSLGMLLILSALCAVGGVLVWQSKKRAG